MPSKTIDEFIALLRQEATVVKKAEELKVKILGKTELLVLSEAVAGNAEVLVTGDADLTEIADQLPLQILSPRGFWEQLRKYPPLS